MKTIRTFLIFLIIGASSHRVALGAPFELSFTPSASEASGLVTGYSAWWQATNAADANQWTWIGSCNAGQTNILFDSTNMPNGVWMTATASSEMLQSYYAEPILFDTNDYPVAITATNAPVQPVRPLAPKFLLIRRRLQPSTTN
jgi:hypothetical protein